MSTLQQLLFDIPPVTRFLAIFSLSLSTLVYLDIVNPMQYYLNI